MGWNKLEKQTNMRKAMDSTLVRAVGSPTLQIATPYHGSNAIGTHLLCLKISSFVFLRCGIKLTQEIFICCVG